MKLTGVLARRLASIVRQCFILRQNLPGLVTLSECQKSFSIVCNRLQHGTLVFSFGFPPAHITSAKADPTAPQQRSF